MKKEKTSINLDKKSQKNKVFSFTNQINYLFGCGVVRK